MKFVFFPSPLTDIFYFLFTFAIRYFTRRVYIYKDAVRIFMRELSVTERDRSILSFVFSIFLKHRTTRHEVELSVVETKVYLYKHNLFLFSLLNIRLYYMKLPILE